MKRFKRIGILLGVLAVVCIATFAALRIEEYQEQIQNSEEVILSLSADDVQSLSWSYDDTSLSFSRDEENIWRWSEDQAFPVSEEKINELLEIFSSFGVSFIIENVEDYGQYGLDAPVCTIKLETEDASYTVELGDFSKLDNQRYISIGDGNAYLVSNDPMDLYEIKIEDVIQNDEALSYDAVSTIRISAQEDYAIQYIEDSADTYFDEDVYFTQRDGVTLPLDTTLVDDYLYAVSSLSFETYVSYNATEAELETYGLNDPELTLTVDYTTSGETEEETVSGTYTLSISRSSEERAKAAEKDSADTDEADDTEEEQYSAYVRVNDSPIIYEVSSTYFESLMASSYDDLRHKEAFPGDFAIVSSMDIELEGKSYTLTAKENDDTADEEGTASWLYGEEEIDIANIQSALESLTASEFTDEVPDGQQEIRLTLRLTDENFPQVEIVLYRYDGTDCLATVDGESFALISRTSVVDLIEAVNAIVLS